MSGIAGLVLATVIVCNHLGCGADSAVATATGTGTGECSSRQVASGRCREARPDAATHGPGAANSSAHELSYTEALQVMCDTPNHLDLESMDPSQRATEIARYIEANAKNAEFEEVLGALAGAPGDAREALMRDALAKAGITRCALLDESAGAAPGDAGPSGPAPAGPGAKQTP